MAEQPGFCLRGGAARRRVSYAGTGYR